MLTSFFKMTLLGQYGRAYNLMIPGQKKYVTKSRYEDCKQEASDSVAGIDFVSAKVIDRYRERTMVPGLRKLTSTVLTMKITIRQNGQKGSFNDTYHTYWTGKRWAWALTASDLKAYRAGRCPK